jgi:hypothetical protein
VWGHRGFPANLDCRSIKPYWCALDAIAVWFASSCSWKLSYSMMKSHIQSSSLPFWRRTYTSSNHLLTVDVYLVLIFNFSSHLFSFLFYKLDQIALQFQTVWPSKPSTLMRTIISFFLCAPCQAALTQTNLNNHFLPVSFDFCLCFSPVSGFRFQLKLAYDWEKRSLASGKWLWTDVSKWKVRWCFIIDTETDSLSSRFQVRKDKNITRIFVNQ